MILAPGQRDDERSTLRRGNEHPGNLRRRRCRYVTGCRDDVTNTNVRLRSGRSRKNLDHFSTNFRYVSKRQTKNRIIRGRYLSSRDQTDLVRLSLPAHIEHSRASIRQPEHLGFPLVRRRHREAVNAFDDVQRRQESRRRAGWIDPGDDNT